MKAKILQRLSEIESKYDVKVWAKYIDTHALKEIDNLSRIPFIYHDLTIISGFQRNIHGIRSENHLDEAASAYKNIDEVMANQQDLVKIVTRLSPLAVVKG